MKYILSHPRLVRSAGPLADRLSEISGQKINVSTVSHPINQCIIRYGNSAPVMNGVGAINNPEHIRLAGNKSRLSQFLVEKEFPHVVFMKRTPEENEFPIVARDVLNGGGGAGIRFIKSEEEYKSGNPVLDWTPWYDFKFELGVHILGGKIAKVFKKIREEGLEEEEFPRRNTNNGYRYSLRSNWADIYPGLSAFIGRLYEIIPIQFARLDVGYSKECGGFRLIEINSAPDLSQNMNTLEMYAEFLVSRIFGG